MKQFYVALLILLAGMVVNNYFSQREPFVRKIPLSGFPTTLHEWKGVEVGLEPEVLTALGATEVLMRRYVTPSISSNHNLVPQIWLYIGYYQSQREGQTYHSPKNCLPGSGWQIIQSEKINVSVGSNKYILVNKMIVQKGLEKETVLYWYQDRGRVVASEYWAKIYMMYDAITHNRTDGAMIRISAPSTDSEERTLQYLTRFVQEVFPHLGRYIPG